MCRRGGAQGASQRADRNRDAYWILRLVPWTPPWPPPRYTLADGKGKIADPDSLHRVYGALLKKLSIHGSHGQALLDRGLPYKWITSAGYGVLPDRGRAKTVQALIESGLE
jgi:hypothetical protein